MLPSTRRGLSNWSLLDATQVTGFSCWAGELCNLQSTYLKGCTVGSGLEWLALSSPRHTRRDTGNWFQKADFFEAKKKPNQNLI
jgi:hypothetical protein